MASAWHRQKSLEPASGINNYRASRVVKTSNMPWSQQIMGIDSEMTIHCVTAPVSRGSIAHNAREHMALTGDTLCVKHSCLLDITVVNSNVGQKWSLSCAVCATCAVAPILVCCGSVSRGKTEMCTVPSFSQELTDWGHGSAFFRLPKFRYVLYCWNIHSSSG